ncbi:MAG: hypothetical protein US76_03020 [Parcubacteria group bacterium GW2011_GWA2_38_13b]|nr:MAG: hypothetical protein US76_03020 [Parcubacteria group bacterium GW2011_GWA2_38_13b]
MIKNNLLTMTNKNQKHVEVIVASTIPEAWEVVKRNNIATQKKNSADADYIVFFRVRLKDKKLGNSAITHIAKVRDSDNNASLKDFFEKNPDLLKYSEKHGKGWERQEYHKEYKLEELKELSEPILCRKGKGEGKRCQVKLYTTREELNRVKYLGDIKTISQL